MGFVAFAVRRWPPTPLCDTCHGVIVWFGQHRWVVIGSRASLCRLTSLTEIFASCTARFARCCMSFSCHCRTLLPFTCADDSCFSLSCTRAAIPTTLNFADRSFIWVRLPLSAFIPAAALLFSLTWLYASWSVARRPRHLCTDQLVYTSGGAL